MRKARPRRIKRWWGWAAACGILATAGVWRFSCYVNTVIKPTLHQLAEYQAREATVQAINEAVAAELQRRPTLCDALYTVQEDGIAMDAAAVNTARTALVAAVQSAMDASPVREYKVPFGSLTDNTLLGGLGPVWKVQFQPQGYVQGEVKETTESLSINTTRYSAVLALQVTVNMVLDGRTATLTVTDEVPLATFLLCGDIPQAYASGVDPA